MRCRGLLAVVVAFISVACQPFRDPDGAAETSEEGGPPVATAAAAPGARNHVKPFEWMFSARNEAIYLMWSAPDGAVSGVVQTATRNSSSGNVKVTSGILAGAANDPHVVLTSDERTWSGTVDGDVLVLAVTRDDGARVELRFVRASIGDFDAAVAALRRTVTTTSTSGRIPPRTRPPRSTTSTSTAPRPAGPDPGEVLAELQAATDRLRNLRAADSAISGVERALDTMYSSADELHSAVGRADCAAAATALGRLASAASGVGGAVASIEQTAGELEDQRAVVMDVGTRVVALDDPGLDPVIEGTNDELGRADVAISELRRYSGEVRDAISSTTADAEAARDAAC